MRTTRGPGSIGPVRSLGPARSMATRQARPSGVVIAHLAHHARPGSFVVVGAVHAGDVHTVARQPSDEVGPVGSFARQCDHDACGSGSRRGTEQAFGVAIQQVLSLAEADSHVVRALLLARQTTEHAEHGLDGGQHVRLGSSQRRDAEHGEPALELADIVVAQLDVVHQVRRRGPVCGCAASISVCH